jgi:hypothetical protein
MAVLAQSAVLEPTAWCVCRPHGDDYLVYNSRTDEMYVISPLGFYLYRLCNGVHCVGEIQAWLADAEHDPATVDAFLSELRDRGVVEVIDD